MIANKNMLSKRSNIPPWPPSEEEKSLIFKYLFTNEKKISPKNRLIADITDRRILKFNNNKINDVAMKEINVPDQVLFGLIFGIINFPAMNFPERYATVSLKKEINIIK